MYRPVILILIFDRCVPYPCLLLVFWFFFAVLVLTIGFLILVWRGRGQNLVQTWLDFAYFCGFFAMVWLDLMRGSRSKPRSDLA